MATVDSTEKAVAVKDKMVGDAADGWKKRQKKKAEDGVKVQKKKKMEKVQSAAGDGVACWTSERGARWWRNLGDPNRAN